MEVVAGCSMPSWWTEKADLKACDYKSGGDASGEFLDSAKYLSTSMLCINIMCTGVFTAFGLSSRNLPVLY